jgi:hypothetical protein
MGAVNYQGPWGFLVFLIPVAVVIGGIIMIWVGQRKNRR